MALLCFPGHVAACDTRRRELYCTACNDYVYDRDFDNAMLVSHVLACGPLPACLLGCSIHYTTALPLLGNLHGSSVWSLDQQRSKAHRL